MQSTSTTPPVLFKLSVPWLEHVFKDRQTAEDLLRPEHDAGNLSFNDYDNALAYFSSLKLQRARPLFYVIIGGACAAYAVSRKRWSPLKQSLVFSGTTIAGSLLAKSQNAYNHLHYVKSIEDRKGYALAIHNIEERVGVTNEHFGHPSIAVFVPRTDDEHQDSSTIVLPTNGSVRNHPQPPDSQPRTKWDEIRKANSRSVGSSTWDNLRQKHERESSRRLPSASGSPAAPVGLFSDQAIEAQEHVDLDKYADRYLHK